MPNKRVCDQCGSSLDGMHGKALRCSEECKSLAAKAYKAEYRETHREQLKLDRAAYYAENRVAVDAVNAAWKVKNPGRAKELANGSANRYYAKNSEKVTAKARAKRQAQPALHKALDSASRAARKAAPADGTVTADFLAELEEGQGSCCYYCGDVEPLDVEHVTPLSRGGHHSADNIVLACAPCNRGRGGKHSKTLEEWLATTAPEHVKARFAFAL